MSGKKRGAAIITDPTRINGDICDDQMLLDVNVLKVLLQDPVRRAKVVELLEKDHENIEKYREQEELKKRGMRCESPSALFRRRVLENLDNPKTAIDPPPMAMDDSPRLPADKLLTGVVAYIEVFSNDVDKSDSTKELVCRMGAQVRDRLAADVTHVIFKDGSYQTYNMASRMRGTRLVSVLWLEAVSKFGKRLPEHRYRPFATVTNTAIKINLTQICNAIEEDMRQPEGSNDSDPTGNNAVAAVCGSPFPKSAEWLKLRRDSMQIYRKNYDRYRPKLVIGEIGSNKNKACLLSSDFDVFKSDDGMVDGTPGGRLNNSLELLDAHAPDKEVFTVPRCGRRRTLYSPVDDCAIALRTCSRPPRTVRYDNSGDDMDLELEVRTSAIITVPMDLTQKRDINFTNVKPISSTEQQSAQCGSKTGLFTNDVHGNESNDNSFVPESMGIDSNQSKNITIQNSELTRDSGIGKLSTLEQPLAAMTAATPSSLEQNTILENLVTHTEVCNEERMTLAIIAGDASSCPVQSKTHSKNILRRKQSGLMTDQSFGDSNCHRKTTCKNQSIPLTTDNASERLSKTSETSLDCETPRLRNGSKVIHNRAVIINTSLGLSLKRPSLKIDDVASQTKRQKTAVAISNRSESSSMCSSKIARKMYKGDDDNRLGYLGLESPLHVSKQAEQLTDTVVKFPVTVNMNVHSRELDLDHTIPYYCGTSKDQPPRTKNNPSRPITRAKTATEYCKFFNDAPDQDELIMPLRNRRSTMEFAPLPSKIAIKKKARSAAGIVCTRFNDSKMNTLRTALKRLGGFRMDDEVVSRSTHLIVGEILRTINMTRAMARGCWILSFDWVTQSMSAGKWLPEGEFELVDFASAVKTNRQKREAAGSRPYTNQLLQSHGTIYVSRASKQRCGELRELVKLCSGSVAPVARSAALVVGETNQHVPCVREAWLLDSIQLNRIMPLHDYRLAPPHAPPPPPPPAPVAPMRRISEDF